MLSFVERFSCILSVLYWRFHCYTLSDPGMKYQRLMHRVILRHRTEPDFMLLTRVQPPTYVTEAGRVDLCFSQKV